MRKSDDIRQDFLFLVALGAYRLVVAKSGNSLKIFRVCEDYSKDVGCV